MANWQTYNFPDAVRGDSYGDVAFEILLNEEPANLTDAVIRMWLVDKQNIVATSIYSTANDKIVITDAAAGKFKIVFGILTLAPGVYNHDIEIEFTDGTVKTWIKGTLTVLNDKTK